MSQFACLRLSFSSDIPELLVWKRNLAFGAFLHRRKQICRPSMFGTEAECHHHQQLVISLTNGVMSRGSGKAFKPKEVTDGDTSLGRLIFRDLHCFTTCSGTCCLQETPLVFNRDLASSSRS